MNVRLNTNVTSIEEIADEDGSWYFSIITRDLAGNWSAPARIEYVRDTTPPPAAAIIPPELDENGYLRSNTFSVQWEPPAASDLAGYTWRLDYLSALGEFAPMDGEAFTAAADSRFVVSQTDSLPPRIMGAGSAASYTNEDNGIWRFTVSAVDEVGNIGPASTIVFRMNKYVPHTFITLVDAAQD
jgi:hypothetical protein